MNIGAKATGKRFLGSEKIRFGLVGVVNTAVDFALLNILVSLFGVPPVAANIVSTTAAMGVSFGLNKRAVFRANAKTRMRQLVVFFAITLTGIWLVQGGVLAAVLYLIGPLGLQQTVALNSAKFAGICVGLVWNYLWYSRVVFKK